MFTKKYPTPVYWLKRLNTTQILQRLKKKIPNVTGLDITAALNTKATEIEHKVPDISDLQ